MRASVTFVSLASPLSPLFLNRLQTASRKPRRAENDRNGSTHDRVLTMIHLPESPRSSAAALAAAAMEAGRPPPGAPPLGDVPLASSGSPFRRKFPNSPRH